jgi:hypothetical protein
MYQFGMGLVIFMKNKELIEECVETICQKGCRFVKQDIRLLQRGEILPEFGVLDDLARQVVLKELRAIMAVYGDRCSTPVCEQSKDDRMKHEQNN